MNPEDRFCPCDACPLRGVRGQGNVVGHGKREGRFLCNACGGTFAATRGTPFYGLRRPSQLVTQVVTLLSHGCPPQAIVAAFGLDERTVARWQQRAGEHCQHVHQRLVQEHGIELPHVQADELRVKLVKGVVWMATALAVVPRLWLGGEISPRRDRDLIWDLVEQVRCCARRLRGVLVCVDGLSSYPQAFWKVFRRPDRASKTVPTPAGSGEPALLLGQVIKQYSGKRVIGVTHRAVYGTMQQIEARIRETATGTGINTAYIERLNATFRSRLASLARRTRSLTRRIATLEAAMYLVGGVYNWCTPHDSLRQRAEAGAGRKWQERTPAMAAGLTDHRWSVEELLWHRIAPPPWKPKRASRKVPTRVRWKLRPRREVVFAPTD